MSSAGNYLSRENALRNASRSHDLSKLFNANRGTWARINDFECDIEHPYERFSKKDFLLTDSSLPIHNHHPMPHHHRRATPHHDDILSIINILAVSEDCDCKPDPAPAPAPAPGSNGKSVPATFAGGSIPATFAGGSIPATFAGGSIPATFAGGSIPAKFAGGSIPAKFAGGSIPAKFVLPCPTQLPLTFTPLGAAIPTSPCGEGWVCTRYEPSATPSSGPPQVDYEIYFRLANVSVPGVLTPQFKMLHLLDPLAPKESPSYKIVNNGSHLELLDSKTPVPPSSTVLNVADKNTQHVLSRQFKLVNASSQTAQPTTNGQLVLLFKLVDAFIPTELTFEYALADVYVTATLLAYITQNAVVILPPAPAPSAAIDGCPGMTCTRWEPKSGPANIGGNPCTWGPPITVPPSASPAPAAAAIIGGSPSTWTPMAESNIGGDPFTWAPVSNTTTGALGGEYARGGPQKKKFIKVSSVVFVNKTDGTINKASLRESTGGSVLMFQDVKPGHTSKLEMASAPMKSSSMRLKLDGSFRGDLHLSEVAGVAKDPHARNIALPIHVSEQGGFQVLAYLKQTSPSVYHIEIVAFN